MWHNNTNVLHSTELVARAVKDLLQCWRPGFNPWVGKIPWRREWLPTPGFLPRKSHGQWSLAGYSPWNHKELTQLSDWTTQAMLNCSLKNGEDDNFIRRVSKNMTVFKPHRLERGFGSIFKIHSHGNSLFFMT